MHPGEPVGETLAAIAARHGVPVRAIRRMPTGAANHVYELGAELVLRIPRTSAFVPDLRKEATVIPRVRRLGIRTPAVVSYDDSCSILGLPYVVLERAPGRDLGRSALPPEKAGALLREVGHQLGMLHRGARSWSGSFRPKPLAVRVVIAGCRFVMVVTTARATETG